MKIVHIYKDYFPPVHGGIEQTINRMAVSHARSGHSVTVLVSSHGERHSSEEWIDGVRVVRVAEWGRALSAPFCPGMPRRLSSIEGDLFHLHYPNPTGEISWMIARPRGALVMSYYSDVVRQSAFMPLYGPAVRWLMDRCDLILATTEKHVDHSSYLRRVRDKCVVVPLGIDLAPFSRPEAHSEQAAEIRRRFAAPLILFVGRLRYYKGLHVLLEAMRSVEATAVIVGDGPMEDALRAQHARLGLGNRVIFAGPISDRDLPSWIAAADIGVLPSTKPSEVYGLAMIEMMASGVPIVCTELGTGTSYVNRDGESGLVVPPDDPRTLSGALQRLVNDGELRRRLGDGARKRANRLFSQESMMAALDSAYGRVLNGPNAGGRELRGMA
jgi:glycosyltransferase involved in cell wall biosynthesis